ncbi:lysophospholipid acyltransferase family protein [Kineococcus arenarius]|uniref:lysophospholipid acyltransferase family protein n=1 Tax=unclassified Kineococcus TaxID=2621656 RepID=UPI003D7C4406
MTRRTRRSPGAPADAEPVRRSRWDRYTSPTWAATHVLAQRAVMKPLLWSVFDVRVHGRSRLLKHPEVAGGRVAFVLVGNHSSHLDAPLIIAALPRRMTRYLSTGAAADYFAATWYRSLLSVLFVNAFPVDRPRGGGAPRPVKAGSRGRATRITALGRRGHAGARSNRGLASALLARDVPLMIFPEGTRSRTGAMGRFNPGTAALCIKRGVPAVPVALVGAHDAMPPDRVLPRGLRPQVHLVFGEPMHPRQGEDAEAFSLRISERVAHLHDVVARYHCLPAISTR